MQPARKLGSAIHKLSPDLAPLTDLADDLAEQTDSAHPAPQFRQNLHNALEKAHQEQTAKRVLGIQPDGLEVFAPSGKAFKFPAWSIDRVLMPWIVRRGIYGGIRPNQPPL